MRITSPLLFGAIAVIFTGVGLVGCGGAAPAENKAAADEVTASWVKAFNSGDAAALAVLYTDTAHSTAPGGGPSTGRKEIEAYWRGDMKPGEITELKATDSIAQGNLLHVSGTYAVSAKDGARVAYGQFEQLWTKVSGDWKVQSEIWSLDPMAQRDADVASRLESAWTAAYNAGDAPALAALYDKDAVLATRPTGSVVGKDAIEYFWKGDFGDGKPTTKLEMTDAYLAGDLAHLEGEYEVDDKGKITKGHYVQLWMQDGDAWRIHREMWWQ
jgi:ketosteroid isomerase-like protein